MFDIFRISFSIIIKLIRVLFLKLFQLIFIKPNTVLLIVQFPNIGGTKKYFQFLLDFYLKNGQKIIIMIKDSEYDEIDVSEYNSNLIKSISYSYELDLIEYNGAIKSINYFKCLDKNISQTLFIYKVCIQNGCKKLVISACLPGTLFSAFLIPIPVVYVMHSMPWGKLDRIGQQFLILALKFNRNKLITVSEYSKKVIRTFWNLNPEDIIVVYNYFEKNSLSINCFNLPRKFILTIGTLSQGKNPFMWIDIANEVVKSHPDIYFVWAGDGILYDRVKELTNRNKNILLFGNVNTVDQLYKLALFYFSPSVRESHGISIIGAMSYGLACIVGNVGGTTESIIDNYNGLLYDPNDFDGFLNGIDFLIKNSNVRNDFGINSTIRFNDMFTKDKWEIKMIEYL